MSKQTPVRFSYIYICIYINGKWYPSYVKRVYDHANQLKTAYFYRKSGILCRKIVFHAWTIEHFQITQYAQIPENFEYFYIKKRYESSILFILFSFEKFKDTVPHFFGNPLWNQQCRLMILQFCTKKRYILISCPKNILPYNIYP